MKSLFFALLLTWLAWAEPYTDPASKAFQYEPPAGWTLQEEQWREPGDGPIQAVMQSDSVPLTEKFSLETWVTRVVEQGKKDKGWTDVQVSELQLDGVPARRIGVTGSKGVRTILFLSVRNQVGAILTFVATAARGPEIEERAATMVQSFHWL